MLAGYRIAINGILAYRFLQLIKAERIGLKWNILGYNFLLQVGYARFVNELALTTARMMQCHL